MEYYWPENLPSLPLKDDYQRGLATNTMRTKMEYGPDKIRRRTSANLEQLVVSYDLNTEHMVAESGSIVNQKDLFVDFLRVVDGLPFWLPDPVDQSRYIKARIKAESEDKSVTLTPLFSKLWNIKLNLEVYPYAFKPRH